MARHLLVFAMAFAVLGAPLASEICQASCAKHAGDSADVNMPASSHHHHSIDIHGAGSHHHHSSPGGAHAPTTTVIGAVSHACGHVDAVLTESRKIVRVSATDALVATVDMTPILVEALSRVHIDSRHGPPVPIRSTSPLRI